MLGNLLASDGRICRALGVATLDELTDRIARLVDVSSPEGWFERLKSGSQPAAISGVTPREVKSAACQQIVRLGGDIDLDELPLLGCGAGVPPARPRGTEEIVGEKPDKLENALPTTSSVPLRAITSAAVFSAEPDSHRPRCGTF